MTQQLPETHSLDDAQPTRSARMAPDVTQKDKHKTQEMVPTVSSGPAWLPQWTKDTGHSFSKHIAKARKSTIESTPAFLVNNASNFLGFMHMLTEMLMFKSGMKGAKLVDNPENLINWVKEPIQKITADIYSRGGAQDYSFGQLFRGNPFKNVNKYIVDTHDASLRELERQVATTACGQPP